MEGSGEGSGGCVVHVDVHGECVLLLLLLLLLLLIIIIIIIIII